MNNLSKFNKVKVNIYDLDPVLRWVCAHAKKTDENLSQSEFQQLVLQKFQRDCDLPDIIKGILKKYSKITDYSLPAYEFFSSQFNEAISLVSIFNPNNTRYKELKNKFYKNITKMRYFPEKSAPKLQKIINELASELLEIEQISPKFEKITKLNSIFDQIFLHNSDLLDVPMAILVGESNFETRNFDSSLFNLFISCNQIIERIIENLSNTVTSVEKNLQKFSQDPIHKTTAEFLLKLLGSFQRRYLHKLLKFQSNSFFDFNQERVNDIFQIGYGLNRILGNTEKDNRVVSKGDEYFESNQNIFFTDNKKAIEKLTSLKDSLKGQLSAEKLDELDRRIDFTEKVSLCFALIEGLVQKPLEIYATSALQIFMNLNLLNENQIKALNKTIFCKLNKKTEIDNKEKEATVPLDLSGDQWDKSIEPFKIKSKKIRTPRRENHPTKSQDIRTDPKKKTKKKENKSLSSKPLTVVPPKKIQKEDKTDYREFRQLSTLLGQLSIRYQDPLVKGCLRQSQMYLDDLIAAHKKLNENHLSENTRRFYTMTLIQSTYFCLEALLQFHAGVTRPDEGVIDGNGHNLQKLATRAGVSEKNQLISELFLANYWVRTPYEQYKVWGNFVVPKLLSDIKKIYEEKNLDEGNLERVLKNISGYLARTKTFIETLPSIEQSVEKITPIAPPRVTTYKLPRTSQLNAFREINKKCEELIPKIPSNLLPKFSQILAHLKLIGGIFEELEKGEVSSDLFSLLLRNLIFWENSFLEGFLQVVYGMKSGKDSRSHNLIKIHQQIAWEVEEKSDSSFLSRDLVNVHNISRYPFSSENILSPLHALILKGELLRERAELGEENPYKLQGKKKNKGSTQLNYLEMSSKDMDPKKIINELYQVTDNILHYVNETVLPELVQSL